MGMKGKAILQLYMPEPGAEKKGQPLVRNLTPEQRDSYQRKLNGLLDSGESIVTETKKLADKFADRQMETVAGPLSRINDRLAGNIASGVVGDVKRESNRVYRNQLENVWGNLADIANAGVFELLKDDMNRAEFESRTGELHERIDNRRRDISEVFPDFAGFIQRVNSSLRDAQNLTGRIDLADPNVVPQADQIRGLQRELSRLLDHNDPKLAEGRQITEGRYQRIMGCVRQIRELVNAIAEARLT